MRAISIVTRSAEETRVLGAALAPLLLPGDVISLSGELGAGKTVFVQGVAGALGVNGKVTSPTFTLVHEYSARYPIVHLDVYRLDLFQEVLDLGFEELLDPEAILLIEWGDAVAPLLPPRYLEVEIRRPSLDAPEDDRILTLRAQGDEWTRKLQETRTTAEMLLSALAPEGAEPARFTEAPVRARERDDRGPRQRPERGG